MLTSLMGIKVAPMSNTMVFTDCYLRSAAIKVFFLTIEWKGFLSCNHGTIVRAYVNA